MGSSNFLVFDENKTNMLADNDYSGSTYRTGGAVSGIATSTAHNKLYYQLSVFVAAFTKAMANQGQTVSDASFSALTTQMDALFSKLWHPSTAYAVGDICFSLNLENHKYLRCTTAGNTASSEPTWTEIGTSVLDGTVYWKVCDLRTLPLTGGALTGVLEMGSNKITGLANGSNAFDAVNFSQLDAVRVPIGTMFPFAGNICPSSFLFCNGAAISRTAYANLFAIIGNVYGEGDGSTTFNLPDFTGGRTAAGKGGAFTTLGETGGEINHLLSIQEIPEHSHTYEVRYEGGGSENIQSWTDSANVDERRETVNTSKVGGGKSHNNMPPYIVTNWIIRY